MQHGQPDKSENTFGILFHVRGYCHWLQPLILSPGRHSILMKTVSRQLRLNTYAEDCLPPENPSLLRYCYKIKQSVHCNKLPTAFLQAD